MYNTTYHFPQAGIHPKRDPWDFTPDLANCNCMYELGH